MFLLPAALTTSSVPAALAAGASAIAAGEREFDCSQLAEVDSAAVATMLAWQRQAMKQDQLVRFSNVPANLRSLMTLYGVDSLLLSAS